MQAAVLAQQSSLEAQAAELRGQVSTARVDVRVSHARTQWEGVSSTGLAEVVAYFAFVRDLCLHQQLPIMMGSPRTGHGMGFALSLDV